MREIYNRYRKQLIINEADIQNIGEIINNK